jgi:hypothetical protein
MAMVAQVAHGLIRLLTLVAAQGLTTIVLVHHQSLQQEARVVVEMAHLMFLTITTGHAVLLSVCLFKTLPQPMEQ